MVPGSCFPVQAGHFFPPDPEILPGYFGILPDLEQIPRFRKFPHLVKNAHKFLTGNGFIFNKVGTDLIQSVQVSFKRLTAFS